jgi:hypothetical protein
MALHNKRATTRGRVDGEELVCRLTLIRLYTLEFGCAGLIEGENRPNLESSSAEKWIGEIA